VSLAVVMTFMARFPHMLTQTWEYYIYMEEGGSKVKECVDETLMQYELQYSQTNATCYVECNIIYEYFCCTWIVRIVLVLYISTELSF